MATIRATCDRCGDIETTSAEFVARLCLDDNTFTYRFRCPSCDMFQLRPTEQKIAELLIASGCSLELWQAPVLEEPADPNAPPIGFDDLIALHAGLDRPDWFDELR